MARLVLRTAPSTVSLLVKIIGRDLFAFQGGDYSGLLLLVAFFSFYTYCLPGTYGISTQGNALTMKFVTG
jgi:hypothetical protein